MPYLFTGKELDEETGLYYYGARYYDPRTSVWASPDPILASYLSGKPNGGVNNSFNLNLFAYAHQNSLKFSDPKGLYPDDALKDFENRKSDIDSADNFNLALFFIGFLGGIVPSLSIFVAGIKTIMRFHRIEQRKGAVNSGLKSKLKKERNDFNDYWKEFTDAGLGKNIKIDDKSIADINKKYDQSVSKVEQWDREIPYMYIDLFFDFASIGGAIITQDGLANLTNKRISLGIQIADGISTGYYYLLSTPGRKTLGDRFEKLGAYYGENKREKDDIDQDLFSPYSEQ